MQGCRPARMAAAGLCRPGSGSGPAAIRKCETDRTGAARTAGQRRARPCRRPKTRSAAPLCGRDSRPGIHCTKSKAPAKPGLGLAPEEPAGNRPFRNYWIIRLPHPLALRPVTGRSLFCGSVPAIAALSPAPRFARRRKQTFYPLPGSAGDACAKASNAQSPLGMQKTAFRGGFAMALRKIRGRAYSQKRSISQINRPKATI